MLGLAIRAGIPIIVARTTDLVNVEEVLKMMHTDIEPWTPTCLSGQAEEKVVFCLPGNYPKTIDAKFYRLCVEKCSTVVLINPMEVPPESFDAGEVPVPKALLERYLEQVVGKEQMPSYSRCVSGLTIKQMVEVIRLTQANYGGMSPRFMMSMRSQLMGKVQGLATVPELDEMYFPPKTLEDWVNLNYVDFLNPVDPRLVPRGVLFHGEPGVGKTMGGRYIAKQFGVPMYRLSLSGALTKWHGESESNVLRVLNTVDQEEPCVMLMDEMEKMFGQTENDNGSIQRILADLLWWLSEHRSRVVTVMTTNKLDVLPKELYREGRVDDVILMEALTPEHAQLFVAKVAEDYNLTPTKDQWKTIRGAVEGAIDSTTKRISHARVVKLVRELIKKHKWHVQPKGEVK